MEYNYVVIQGWMTKELKLSGNDLLIYALIYGFSQDEESEFYGSRSYIANMFNISLPTVDKSLNNLIKKDLIIKKVIKNNGIIINTYKISLYPIKKLYTPYKETLHNNIINNDSNNNLLINNTNILTSNINNDTNKNKIKNNKKNLYEKCLEHIDKFCSENECDELKSDLEQFVKNLLEASKETGKPIYSNIIIAKINKLKKFNKNKWAKIVTNTLDNYWLNFIDIKDENDKYNVRNKPWNKNVKSIGYTDKELEEFEKLKKERESNGIKTTF